MVWYEIIEGKEHTQAIDILNGYRKWRTEFLSVQDKSDLLREVMLQVPYPQRRAFIFLTYLTSARRNEIAALRREDIVYKDYTAMNGKTFKIMVLNMINEKNPNVPMKLIPIIKGLDPIEDKMIEEVESYIKENTSDLEPSLFDNTYSSKYNQFLEQVTLVARYREPRWAIEWSLTLKFHLYPHYLRHCRLTHLGYIDYLQLCRIAGWSARTQLGSGGKQAETYVHKSIDAIVERMLQPHLKG
jgi:integrase